MLKYKNGGAIEKDIQSECRKIRPLRHSELRKGEDFSSTSYFRDNDNETFHLAYVKEKKIVVCATFYPEFSESCKRKCI